MGALRFLRRRGAASALVAAEACALAPALTAVHGRDAGVPLHPVDLNAATAPELSLLPGIGPSLAGAIVADRAANGPFRSVAELDRVRGVGPAMLARIAPHAAAAVPAPASAYAAP